MAEPKPPPELLAKTLELAERQAAERESAAEHPPAVGDLYVLHATCEYDVEWLLVAQDPADRSRFLAIPADGHFLAGTADIALPAAPSIGRLTLRCRHGVWLEAEDLESERRVGEVESRWVAQARQKWLDVGNGEHPGTVLEREADEDPEYQEWVETVLAPARRELLAGEELRGEISGGEPVDRRTPPKRPPKIYLVAAALVLALGATLAGTVLWKQSHQLRTLQALNEDLENRHREEIEKLQGERRQLEAEYRRQLEEIGDESEAALGELRHKIEELDVRLEQKTREAAVVNPVLALFDPPGQTVRGKVEIEIPPEASHVFLLISTLGLEPAPRYRLELREPGNPDPIWSSDQLVADEIGEIRAGIPAGAFRAGKYELKLEVLNGRKYREIWESELIVRMMPKPN